jgi:phage-related protein
VEKIGERRLYWMGDSDKVLRSFPKEVREDIGRSLRQVQNGIKPHDAKPLSGTSGGVLEIVTRHDRETYRTVYAAKIGDAVYVLHVFHKKSKSGIKTPKQDIDIITKRFKEAQRDAAS